MPSCTYITVVIKSKQVFDHLLSEGELTMWRVFHNIDFMKKMKAEYAIK
jgi:hypothetical protein